MQFLGPEKILIVTPAEASLRDLSLKKVLWSTRLREPPADPSISAAASAPPVFADHDKLWICLGDQVKCLDQTTGAIKQTVPITGRFVSFTPADTTLLVVSAPDETRRIALRIELSSGAISSQEITVPRKLNLSFQEISKLFQQSYFVVLFHLPQTSACLRCTIPCSRARR